MYLLRSRACPALKSLKSKLHSASESYWKRLILTIPAICFETSLKNLIISDSSTPNMIERVCIIRSAGIHGSKVSSGSGPARLLDRNSTKELLDLYNVSKRRLHVPCIWRIMILTQRNGGGFRNGCQM